MISVGSSIIIETGQKLLKQFLGQAETDKAIERKLRHWAGDCAMHVLHLFESEQPYNKWPRELIAVAHQRAEGAIPNYDMATRGYTAADAAVSRAAKAAARAATGAALCSVSFLDIVANVATTAEPVKENSEDDEVAELVWQLERLRYWMTDPNPVPLETPQPCERETT